jgi:hypothetical protein
MIILPRGAEIWPLNDWGPSESRPEGQGPRLVGGFDKLKVEVHIFMEVGADTLNHVPRSFEPSCRSIRRPRIGPATALGSAF